MAGGSKKCLLPWWRLFLLSSIVVTAYGQNDLSVDVGGKRFVIVDQNNNWYDANIDCAAAGMSLAAIESETEYKAIRKLVFDNDLFGEDFWLSGNNLAGGSEFTWLSNGNKFRYTQWKAGSPTGTDLCVFINSQFKWDSVTCTVLTNSKYYICARPLVPNCGITGRCKRISNFN